MDFSLTDEQQQLRRTVREFAEGEILPHVMEWDEVSHFPTEIIPKLAEMGFLGVIFPEKYGGAGMGYIEYAIIIEELSRVDGSVGMIVAAHNSLCTNHIYKFGTEAAEKEIRAAAGARQEAGLLVADGAGSWLGCRGDAHIRCEERWRLADQRLENVYYKRPLRRCVRGHGGDRLREERATGFRHSSSRRARQAFAPEKKKTSWGCAPATPSK